MKFENEGARMLFLRYAIPCSETLARRGVISQNHKRRLMKAVFLKKEIPKDSERIFQVANSMCEKIAKKLGKKTIDEDTVRKYFLFNHDKIVDKRYRMFGDFNPLLCRLYSGKVLSLKDGRATVQTIIGKKKYKTNIIQDLKTGDSVVVHRNFIIEKIDKNLAKKLWKLKESYFKSKKYKIV